MVAVPSATTTRKRRHRGTKRVGWSGLLYATSIAAIVLAVAVAVGGPMIGLHTVRLATGSMSPGLPAGSLLLVRDTPAAEVQPGDVVMVQRPDQRPVTHRVVAVDGPKAETDGRIALTLRGDANATDDPQPYLVDRVGRMVVGIPWGGQLAEFVRSPIGMGALTVLFSSLVLWVLWPAGRSTQAEPIESQPE